MSILATIFAPAIIKTIADSLIGKVSDAFVAYQNKQINQAELSARVQQALMESFVEVEKALLDSIAKTYGSFMQMLAASPAMQRAVMVVLFSQLFVLIWHQLGIPFIVFLGLAKSYPSSGATVDWAYALIGLCLGVPQIATRVGSVGSWATDTLRKLNSK